MLTLNGWGVDSINVNSFTKISAQIENYAKQYRKFEKFEEREKNLKKLLSKMPTILVMNCDSSSGREDQKKYGL